MKMPSVVLGLGGLFAFIGALMPLANAGDLYVSVSHAGGVYFLLYLLPLILIAFALMHQAGAMSSLLWPVVMVAVPGLVLALMGANAAMDYIAFFGNAGALFNNMAGAINMNIAKPSVGVGAVVMVVSYLVSAVAVVSKSRAES